jgi:hypothetical protein
MCAVLLLFFERGVYRCCRSRTYGQGLSQVLNPDFFLPNFVVALLSGRVSLLLKRVGFCIWVPGCPISRREGYVPEHRIGQHEFHSHLRMLALTSGYVGHNTFQCRLCLDVRQSEPLSSVHLRR